MTAWYFFPNPFLLMQTPFSDIITSWDTWESTVSQVNDKFLMPKFIIAIIINREIRCLCYLVIISWGALVLRPSSFCKCSLDWCGLCLAAFTADKGKFHMWNEKGTGKVDSRWENSVVCLHPSSPSSFRGTNPFATVKLRPTTTNDRSAPRILWLTSSYTCWV